MVSLGDIGYVAVFRQIFDHWLWQDKPFSKGQAWIDLLLLANHHDHKKPVGDKIVTYKRGDVNRSVLFLADRWGWDKKTVRRFLRVLEADNMVVVKGTTQGTTITIVNYDFWQKNGSTKGTTDGTTHGTVYGTTHGTQTIMNNNDNNEKNEVVVPNAPTLTDIRFFCIDNSLHHVDKEKFFDYYSEMNWTYKGKPINWQKKLIEWDKKDKEKQQKPPNSFHNFNQRNNSGLGAELLRKQIEMVKAQKGE